MAVKAEQDLYLDPSIRDWVLVPITLIMVLVGILRHYVTVLLNSSPKKQPAAVVREQRALGRALLLRSTSPLSPLPPAQYKSFTSSLSAGFSAGEWLRAKPKTESQDAVANPFEAGGMDGAMDGMKKQAVMMVPNMVLMQYISMFFSGFVLIKLPFPLTLGFKSLLSRDLAMADLDVRWVSALSWYFLNLFGLNGVFKLILGSENPAADTRDLTSTMALSGAGTVPMGGPGAPDPEKLYNAEVENLALAEGMYRWVGEGVEARVLERG
ncbi:ER membrane protein complex subunit 3 [Saitozyma sp. JCM 24511]|nr:ER membrane protein complex subunit 3 [Saitozyma sp. JCM 24511]